MASMPQVRDHGRPDRRLLSHDVRYPPNPCMKKPTNILFCRCRCKAQFCYLCGTPWRNCSCERWNEDDLIARAGEVVDREALRPLAPQERQLRVVAMRQELLDQHECNHPGKFQTVTGASGAKLARCEFCNARHRNYLLRCRRCHVQVCQDCRNNRI